MRKVCFILLCFIILGHPMKGQDSTQLSFSAYAEVYYNYDFSKPANHTRPSFTYNYNRSEEVTVNLAMMRINYSSSEVRANLGLMAGTYANANLAAEPGVLKNIFEANAGVRISKLQQLWVDAGILASHIGFESAIGKDCWTLTRSLAAENSPYYEAGVRLSYHSINKKWYTAFLLLNGWQRIQRVAGNHTISLGSQVTFKPNENVQFNASTYIGSDQPDTARRMRYFLNLYSQLQLSDRIGVTIGLDVGMEQKQKGSSIMNTWYTPVLIVRSRFTQNKWLSVRAEYYDDIYGVIISHINNYPFKTWGLSSNFDWTISPHLLWRIEGRWLQNKHPIFLQSDGVYDRSNWSVTTAFCFSFEKH